MSNININTLSNGLRVATDTMHDVESAMVVLAVKTGSRNETLLNNGISHFLEHMVFKGTDKRSALEIAESIDMVGGIMNASTNKEMTVYHIKVIREHVELAFDVISDIICNSTFNEVELEKERGVILQELSSTLDTLDDVVFDFFHDKAYDNDPLGMTILGPAENIKKFQRQDFLDYMNQYYYGENMVLSVCGNIEHGQVLELAQKYFSGIKGGYKETNRAMAKYVGGDIIKVKQDLEQVQFLLGFPAFSYNDKRYYQMQILSVILGGGMSSRLLQEIREKRGLAYAVSSYTECYSDVGMLCVYADVLPNKVDDMVDAVSGELRKICEKIEDKEVTKITNKAKAELLMSLESTTERAEKLANDYLIYGRYITHQEILKEISEITAEKLQSLAIEIFNNAKQTPPTLALYGNVDDKFNTSEVFRNLV
jgi:predicted Zn-dependent peptidase